MTILTPNELRKALELSLLPTNTKPHNTNCPNCGAPVDIHGEKCEYCGTFYITEVKRCVETLKAKARLLETIRQQEELTKEAIDAITLYADNSPVLTLMKKKG